jgi:hypothetical protein
LQTCATWSTTINNLFPRFRLFLAENWLKPFWFRPVRVKDEDLVSSENWTLEKIENRTVKLVGQAMELFKWVQITDPG